MHQGLRGRAEQRQGIAAEEVPEGGVGEGVAAEAVELGDQLGRVIGERPEARLALVERGGALGHRLLEALAGALVEQLARLALRHVAGVHHPAPLPLGRREGARRVLDPEVVAVAMADAHDEARGAPRLARGLREGARGGLVVGMHEVGGKPAEERLAGIAEHLLVARIHVGEALVAVELRHEVEGALGQRAEALLGVVQRRLGAVAELRLPAHRAAPGDVELEREAAGREPEPERPEEEGHGARGGARPRAGSVDEGGGGDERRDAEQQALRAPAAFAPRLAREKRRTAARLPAGSRTSPIHRSRLPKPPQLPAAAASLAPRRTPMPIVARATHRGRGRARRPAPRRAAPLERAATARRSRARPSARGRTPGRPRPAPRARRPSSAPRGAHGWPRSRPPTPGRRKRARDWERAAGRPPLPPRSRLLYHFPGRSWSGPAGRRPSSRGSRRRLRARARRTRGRCAPARRDRAARATTARPVKRWDSAPAEVEGGQRLAGARGALGEHEARPERDHRDAEGRELPRGVRGDAVEGGLADAVGHVPGVLRRARRAHVHDQARRLRAPRAAPRSGWPRRPSACRRRSCRPSSRAASPRRAAPR